jgi:hypothetical protein
MVPRKKNFDCFLECLITPQSNQHTFLSKKILIFHISIQLNFYFSHYCASSLCFSAKRKQDDIEPQAKRALTNKSHSNSTSFNNRLGEGPMRPRSDLKSAINSTALFIQHNKDDSKIQTDIRHITLIHKNVTGECEAMDTDSDNMIIDDEKMDVDNNDIDTDDQNMDIDNVTTIAGRKKTFA